MSERLTPIGGIHRDGCRKGGEVWRFAYAAPHSIRYPDGVGFESRVIGAVSGPPEDLIFHAGAREVLARGEGVGSRIDEPHVPAGFRDTGAFLSRHPSVLLRAFWKGGCFGGAAFSFGMVGRWALGEIGRQWWGATAGHALATSPYMMAAIAAGACAAGLVGALAAFRGGAIEGVTGHVVRMGGERPGLCFVPDEAQGSYPTGVPIPLDLHPAVERWLEGEAKGAQEQLLTATAGRGKHRE